ncbi:MAG: hypothetical protein ACOYXC_05165 [Candidatus Rifleibacteriota bacterium]
MEPNKNLNENHHEIIDMTGRRVLVPKKVNRVFAASFYGYTMLAALAPESVAATPLPPKDCDKKFCIRIFIICRLSRKLPMSMP